MKLIEVSQSSLQQLLITNILTIILAVAFQANIIVILLSYVIQTAIITIFAFAKLSGYKPSSRKEKVIAIETMMVMFFILIFNLFYIVFINMMTLFPGLKANSFDYLFLLIASLMFFINHYLSYDKHKTEYSKYVPTLALSKLLIRTVFMHGALIFGTIFIIGLSILGGVFSTILIIFAMLIKTGIDLVLHYTEHNTKNDFVRNILYKHIK